MKRWLLTLCLVGSCWAQGHVLAPVNGGTGDNTLLQYGILVGEGLSPVNLVTPGADSVPLWQTAASDPVATAIPDCDDTLGQHLNYDTTTHTLSCGTSSSGGGITGSGTTDRMTKWTGATSIGDSDVDNSVNNTLQAKAGGTDLTIRGGQPGNVNSALGTTQIFGSNITGAGGPLSQASPIYIRAGNNQGTDSASLAGAIEITPGRSPNGGLQGTLILDNLYLGSPTQWYLACIDPVIPDTIVDCGASPQNWIGVSDNVGGANTHIHVPPSQSPISADAPVTVGHTVCAGSSAGQVTDSGGTSSCTNAQGSTVGVVIRVSGTFKFGDNDVETLSTTLPLISMNTSAVQATAGTTYSGVAPIAVSGANISLQNSAAANVTAALGTDTEYFTASGSAATANHLIEGDAQGGIADNGNYTPQSQASAVGTCLSSYDKSTGAFGTAPCVPGPQAVGGLVGGSVGGGGSSSNAPWYGTSASAPNHIQSFSSWWASLTVYVQTVTATNNGYVEYFITDNTTSASTKKQDFGRLVTPSNPAVGVYTEHSSVSPFYVLGSYYSYAQQDVISGGNGGLVGSWTAVVLGSYSQPYDWVAASSTFPLSSTRYSGPGYGPVTTLTTENVAGIVIPLAGTWDYQCVMVNGSQSATGSLVATLDYTSAGVTTASAVVTTVPAASPGNDNVFCDYANTQATIAGDWVSWKWVNNATVASSTVRSAGIRFTPTTPGQGAIVWPLGGRTITNNQQTGPAFYNTGLTASGTPTPMPRAGTMDNLYCLVTTAPGTNDEQVTVNLNAAPTALSATLPTTGCTNLVCSDTTHSFSFSALDTVTLQFNHSAGTTPVISSCSARITWS